MTQTAEEVYTAEPDYTETCEVCGASPCVDLYLDGKLVHSTGMCGVCTWGEADCADPENW